MHNFSVLLSVYNKEESIYLEEAVKSISSNQSLIPTEIILIKDGTLNQELESTIHNLEERIPYLKVYGYEENKGLGFALNYGLERCSYDLVFRMDTDDIAHPERFEIQLNCLKKKPEVSIIGSNIEEFNIIPGDLEQFRIVPITSEEIHKNKRKRNPFNHMTVLFKKSIVQEFGGYKEMPGYEDYYLWMRLLEKSDGININKSLVYARIGNNMIKRRQGIEFMIKEFRFQFTLLSENLISNRFFLRNVFIRGLSRLLPSSILQIVYTKLLRK